LEVRKSLRVFGEKLQKGQENADKTTKGIKPQGGKFSSTLGTEQGNAER